MNQLKQGDPWPFPPSRGITGHPLDAPQWFAMMTAPQREAKTAAKFERENIEVTYPTRQRTRHIRGKRYDWVQPTVGQLIYAKFHRVPNWDVMKDRRMISGVISIGERPCAISSDVVRTMMGLESVASELERARIAALTPAAGERVKLHNSIFGDDFFVDVTRSEFGRVWYEGLQGIVKIKGEANIEDVERKTK